MAANITPLPQHRDLETTPASEHPTDGEREAGRQDARVAADTDARAMRRLAPSPSTLVMIGASAGAALLGGAFGYWLGSRRASRAEYEAKMTAAKANSLVALAPVAFGLLQNPMVRQLAVRLLLRQISSRLHA